MDKHFNTAGPGEADLHYLIDPLTRVNLEEVESLIEQRRDFVLHAPRQTGKTSCLLALRDHLNAEGQYAALYVNVESAQAMRSEQIERYLTRLGLPDGYVVIFDQRTEALPWKQRMLASEAVTVSGRPVLVLRD
jgi:hypothetical protein